MNPFLSVIMSVHNERIFVKDAIDSILNQSYDNFEFIIVDDASDVETADICEKYASKFSKIKLIRNENNLGLTRSLNIGLKHAKGKYIARMDADDISLPDRFTTQIEYLESTPDIGLVGSFYDEIDEKGLVIRKNVNFPTEPIIIHWRLFFENPIPHPPIMMRNNLIDELNGYNENVKYSQDYELFSRLRMKTKISNIPEVLYRWRIHKKSISNVKKNTQRKIAMSISKQILENVSKQNISDHDIDLIWNKKINNAIDSKRYLRLLYDFYKYTLLQKTWSNSEVRLFKDYIAIKLFYYMVDFSKGSIPIIILIKIFFIKPSTLLRIIISHYFK